MVQSAAVNAGDRALRDLQGGAYMMLSRHLSIDLENTATGVCVNLGGVLDYAVRDHLAAAVDCLFGQTPSTIEINLAELRLLDGSAISILIRLQRQARQRGCRLYVSHTHGIVARALTITDTLAALTCDLPTDSRHADDADFEDA